MNPNPNNRHKQRQTIEHSLCCWVANSFLPQPPRLDGTGGRVCVLPALSQVWEAALAVSRLFSSTASVISWWEIVGSGAKCERERKRERGRERERGSLTQRRDPEKKYLVGAGWSTPHSQCARLPGSADLSRARPQRGPLCDWLIMMLRWYFLTC